MRKVIAIGLDGFPFTLANRFIIEGIMPNLAELAREAEIVQMDSVFPTVSSVAWSAFQTGKNPGKFDVFGFGDLDSSLRLYIPDSTHLKSETIWEIMSRRGKRIIALGVPGTYPPRVVNGIIVGDFISPSLEKATYPPSLLPRLRETGYIVDINPMKARESLEYFKEENLRVFQGRVKTLFSLWDTESWDLFVIHFMDTDRVNHFLFSSWDSEGSLNENKKYFVEFYRKVDEMLRKVRERLDDNTGLVILSDHGFCRLKKEVQLNRWLHEMGYLKFQHPPQSDLDFEAISTESKAFSLTPGRIYIMKEGKYCIGKVKNVEYENMRNGLINNLKNLQCDGEAVCKQIFKKEDLFQGGCLEKAPDIVIDPENGYDLKAGLKKIEIFESGPISGMHTYSDAMLYIRGVTSYPKRPVIWDLAPTILDMFDLPIPDDMDGVSLIS